MTSHRKRPDLKTIRPIHLYEAEFHPIDGDDLVRAYEPKFVTVYAHMEVSKIDDLIEHLKYQKEVKNQGIVLISLTGRIS